MQTGSGKTSKKSFKTTTTATATTTTTTTTTYLVHQLGDALVHVDEYFVVVHALSLIFGRELDQLALGNLGLFILWVVFEEDHCGHLHAENPGLVGAALLQELVEVEKNIGWSIEASR